MTELLLRKPIDFASANQKKGGEEKSEVLRKSPNVSQNREEKPW